jgi:flagellar hook protein FlgE
MVIHPLYSALAGMSTNAAKLAVAAHNIANVNTYGFKKSTATMETNAAGQPTIKVTQSNIPGPIIQAPQGLPGGEIFREMSNVSLAEEFVHMKLAEIGYKASTSILQAQDEMIGTILDILV